MNLVLENNGLGYGILITLETYNELRGSNHGMVYCYSQILNDQLILAGFSSKSEREFFKKLILVPGIGPKLAIRSLSQVSYKEFNNWILSGDEKSISKINGIGKKTSSKIILEISDKLIPLGDANNKNLISFNEASMALESLGFNVSRISIALKEIKKSDNITALEDIIKKALVILNKK